MVEAYGIVQRLVADVTSSQLRVEGKGGEKATAAPRVPPTELESKIRYVPVQFAPAPHLAHFVPTTSGIRS